MDNHQQALILFKEIQDIQGYDLKPKILKFKESLTSIHIIHQLVSMGIFKVVLSYFISLPNEVLQVIELLIKDRETAQSFINSSFYEEFLPLINEQTQPEIIISFLRIIRLVTRYTKTNPDIIIPFISNFINPQYIDSVEILNNFLSYHIQISYPDSLEPLVGKFIYTTQPSDYVLSVYYNIFTTGEDALIHIDDLIKVLPRSEQTKTFVVGIFTKIMAGYLSGKKTIDQTKLNECVMKLLSSNVLNQISSFLSDSYNITMISFILTYFEFVSSDYRGISYIKMSNALHNIIMLLENTFISMRCYEKIFNIMTNCSTDNTLYFAFRSLNIIRYISDIIEMRNIKEPNTLNAAYKVLFAYMNQDDYSLLTNIINKNDSDNIVWLCIVAKTENPRQHIAENIIRYLNNDTLYVIVDCIIKYFNSIVKLKEEIKKEFKTEEESCCEILIKSLIQGYQVNQIIYLFNQYNIKIEDKWIKNIDIDSFFITIQKNNIPTIQLIKFYSLLLSSPSLNNNIILLNTIFEINDNNDFSIQKEIIHFFILAIQTSAIHLIDDLDWIDCLFTRFSSIPQLHQQLIQFLTIYNHIKPFKNEFKLKVLNFLTSLLDTNQTEECCSLIIELSN
ncbi:hypothetical protein EHI8A_098580 [Entamoeba histolytica HM-1:IMSS-B]|uniref:Uncharacterized protein n=5 Tax=Entamoeba histolytica TaxID=5759 RepID=C4LYS8_ENTH1|nr:hypothetical protein EHI_010310 [Entamoeba histolytica HM-1:IMSS]EMH73257.1 hypothetical protein EHI8A_098580 [Entamoeba histolytica HM-1:IMSS-B]EMS12854.1 hypothetical protein KM1_227490 [Entamoeba histolytica HM-3:IMSS]ENY59816.1 hypothetical protein EHI7A_099370 [Entamoeba histolytica HM-1:IMSS-A]GAT93993.1 hypothetical protein CL6EHI_010310 [Entamoeba histolytica]EAL49440.1 hypothetical protein EHI_010310 [Entamoeba histolytica HM-1:IMSS]|eukprot:XP_654826.1 hypothetical protein EHI_010310 [Entamoeba histolytica HM-1:IMSS]